MELIPTIQKLLAPMHRRVMLMVSRCVVSLVNDSLEMQRLQVTVLSGEVRDQVERFQEYGFTSNPFAGAEGVMVSVGGNHDHGIVIAVDDRRYRLQGLSGGEVALYDDQGQKVHLTREGIVIDGAGKPLMITNTPEVTLDTPVAHLTGSLQVDGAVTSDAEITGFASSSAPISLSGIRSWGNGHDHNDPQGGVSGTANQTL